MWNLQFTDGKQIRDLVLISIVAFASNLPRIAVGDSIVPTPTKTKPIVSVMSFGAVGDGIADDTQAIQNAMDSMRNGGTLEFPAGTYKYASTLKLTKPNVKLWGYGATLTPTNVNSQAIHLKARNTHMYGFKKDSPSSWKRGECQPHGPNCWSIAAIRSDNHEIIDNEVRHGGSIHVLGSTNVLVGRNTVYRTVADAIHVDGESESSDIKIFQNIVRENGDDMIAVVSYGTNAADRVKNVLIEDNDVAGNYWGRGISVVGSRDVTIRNNSIALVAAGAGIRVVSEDPPNKPMVHPPVDNVLIENNTIRQIQVLAPVFNRLDTWTRSGHGGIHINGSHGPTHYVEDVMVRNNVVDNTYKNGITVTGYVSKVGLVGNSLYNVGRDPIGVIDLKRDDKKIACSGNTYNGYTTSHPRCGGTMPNVTGSAL